MNNDKNDFSNFLKKEGLWKYTMDIIFENITIFRDAKFPNEFIIEVIKRKYSSFSEIKKVFSLDYSTENLFIILGNTLSELSKTFEKEKIDVFNLVKQQKNDNLEIILDEMKKIFTNQSNENKNKFIFLRDKFFIKYINLYKDKSINDLKNLILLNDMIKIYRKIDDSLDCDVILQLLRNIHSTGLDMIKAGLLKNEDLLYFIDNDSIFEDLSYHNNEEKKPLFILNGIELETMNEEFFIRWKKSNILKAYKYIFKSKFEKAFIYKAKNITDFQTIYKLLDYDNSNIYDRQSFLSFFYKFMEFLDSNEIKEENNFAYNISFIFYLLNKINFNEEEKCHEFYQEVIEIIVEKIIVKTFPDIHIIENIYNELTTKYDNIKLEIKDLIYNYLIKHDNNIIKGREIFILYQKLNMSETKNFILEYLDNFMITKEKLFSDQNEETSFKLFSAIQDSEIIEAIPEILKTTYYKRIYDFRLEISKIIKNGEIKYGLINWINKKNLQIIENKLFILFNNFKIFGIVRNNFNKYFNKIYEQINDFDILLNKIKNNESIFYSDIEKIKNIKINLNDKFLCEIDIKNLKEEYKKINANIEKKFKLKTSIIFNNLFNLKKKLNLSNDDKTIFNETEKDIIKLKMIFEKNIDTTEENILRLFFESMHDLDENVIEKELIVLKNFFELNIEDIYLNILKDKIIILLTKQKVLQKINENLLLFFEMEKNNFNCLKDFKESLIKIDSLLNSNNIKEIIKERNIELENKNLKLNEEKIKEEKNNEIKTKYEDINLSIDFIRYHRLLTSNEKLKDLKIKELEKKLSIYPFELKDENEKIINVNIKTFDEKIYFSFYCKNTDIFSDYVSKFYGLYPQFIITDNIFKTKDEVIDTNKSFKDNEIHEGDIIILFYKN